MAKPVATPSYQFFGCFNAFFSTIWQKTRVGLVSLKFFHLWRILGHPSDGVLVPHFSASRLEVGMASEVAAPSPQPLKKALNLVP